MVVGVSQSLAAVARALGPVAPAAYAAVIASQFNPLAVSASRVLGELEQAAEITEQSVKTIRRRISDGTIPAYRFGPRQIRIKLEGLEAMARRIPSARW